MEFQLAGINQVQMKDQIGLNFAAALRAFLRQDPNIILVGEIRDFETAEIAVKAALTGHLVLSTLHTNDAPSTISRLMNMGIEPFLVATSVNLICAQRLVRRVCANCKEGQDVPEQAMLDAGYTQDEGKDGRSSSARDAEPATKADTKVAWAYTKSWKSATNARIDPRGRLLAGAEKESNRYRNDYAAEERTDQDRRRTNHDRGSRT